MVTPLGVMVDTLVVYNPTDRPKGLEIITD